MRKIRKIESTLPTLPSRKKVAAYARVSEEKGRTFHSMSAQISHYSSYIQKNKEWIYVGVYADEGITGTTDKRSEFQRMIKDCEEGKIDIILTKSISRFARNTVDLLETVRYLKDLGIEVRFESEKISSLSDDGELMLTLLASFAQEESRSISENVKWGIRKGFQKGIVNSFCIYGYRWDGEQFNIVPEEAEVIKLIYDNFLSGMSAEETEKQLKDMGIKSYTGGHFSNTSIRAILKQKKYTGNSLLQKVYVENHITQRSVINKGELPMYYAEGTHPVIIEKEIFDKVQAEIARRRKLGPLANKALNTTCFTSKIKCDICGESYRRSCRRQKKDSDELYCIWTCRTKSEKGVKHCSAKDIPEKMLKKHIAIALNLDEFDEDIFSEDIEKLVVRGEDELILYFYDGQILTQKWKSTARVECWTPEARKKKSAYMKKNPRSSGTITCFSSKIGCSKCGQNLRRNTSTRVSGEKARHWRCPPKNKCGHKGLEENLLKNISADVLGIEKFDEDKFTDEIARVTVVSNEELVFHLNDGREITKHWQAKIQQPPWSEERKNKQSKMMKKVWRDKHEHKYN